MLPPIPPAGADPQVLIEQGRYKLALAELTGPDAHTAYLKSKAEAGLGDLEPATVGLAVASIKELWSFGRLTGAL